ARSKRRHPWPHVTAPPPSTLQRSYFSWIACSPRRGMSVATLTGLTVRYGAKTAVNDLSVTVPDGCVGLLGPNGAGKSTLLKTLLGFLKPAAGTGSVLGCDIASQGMQIRQRVGLMPEIDCHMPGMNAVTFVAF